MTTICFCECASVVLFHSFLHFRSIDKRTTHASVITEGAAADKAFNKSPQKGDCANIILCSLYYKKCILCIKKSAGSKCNQAYRGVEIFEFEREVFLDEILPSHFILFDRRLNWSKSSTAKMKMKYSVPFLLQI